MAIPNVTLTINDGGLGLAPESSDGIQVKIGVSSSGTPLTLYPFTPASLSGALVSTLQQGPLVDATAVALNQVVNGLAPSLIYAMPVTPSTAASSGSVTVVRTSTSTGTVATTGSSPRDTYQVKLTIVTTGTLGAGTFKYTLDGGDSESAEITIPGGGTYTIPNSGVVAVFTAGAGPIFFEAGDTFSWTTTAPALTTSDIATAITALLATTVPWEFLHIVGAPVDHTATATLFAALATHAATFEANKRYRSIIMEASDSSDANLVTAMASSSSTRMVVGAGWAEIYIPSTKQVQKRPSAWLLAGRASAIPVHEDLGEVASGPVTGVVPNTAAANGLYANAELSPTLDTARFSTLREFINKDPAGIYVTNAKMFGASTSDFRYWQHRRTMDKACTLARTILLQLLNSNVRVERSGPRKGMIVETVASQIEDSATAQLRAVMSKHVSDITVKLSRTDNLLSSETISVQIQLIPLAYFKQISATIGFVNPALIPGAA